MEEKNIEEKVIEKKKGNKKIIVLVIILVIIIVGLVSYIAYDKGIIFSNEKNTLEKSNIVDKEKKTDKTNDTTYNNTNNEIKELDLTKCLNNKTNSYSNPTDVAGDYGLSMLVNQDKKSITLSIDWAKFGPLSTATAWAPTVENYQITGFSKEVTSTFVGDYGQDSMGITLFYLMSDGTVEYTPMFNLKFDSNNNSYYEMNYTYEYSSDNRITGEHFTTKGTLNNANNVIKLYTVDASNGSGWRTTIGATKEGSFYDLGDIINK